LDAVRQAGLEFTRLRECPPARELFDEDPHEYERRLRVPLFLLIEARRPRRRRVEGQSSQSSS
jgi:hypothetical protein